MSEMTGGRPHQGVVLEAERMFFPRAYFLEPLDEAVVRVKGCEREISSGGSFPFWIGLSGIIDPQVGPNHR